ncbi:insulinase family protein [bacterium]|nr:insulinase family protein [bacterium]
MKNFILKNNIQTICKENKNTPRTAVCFNIAINKPEKSAGIYSLMNRLFLQGTKTRTAVELANELEENAIEVSCDMKQDYLRFRMVCLNEDLEHGIEILQDIIENSTFNDFEKEKNKLEGEIPAELDSAKTRALDNYVKTIYKNHFYGDTFTKVFENLNNIKKDDVVNAYNEIISTGEKVIVVVGDINTATIQELLNKHFGNIKNENTGKNEIPTPVLEKSETVEFIKDDANQAQIIQGWIVPTIHSKEYAPFFVLNTLLGASGLSSRLFCELRDKKGLAYTVRSSYEVNRACANFNIYIATEPKNIQTSLDGFKEEIQKIKDVLVSEEELQNAKNNYIGKLQYITETNMQQAIQIAHYAIMGLGYNYREKFIEQIKQVTPQEIQEIAKKYLNDISVVSILRP